MRTIYHRLLQLHPPQFRARFEEEMLWIFDESAQRAGLWLICDAVLSLFRQWLFRSKYRFQISKPSTPLSASIERLVDSVGVPMFIVSNLLVSGQLLVFVVLGGTRNLQFGQFVTAWALFVCGLGALAALRVVLVRQLRLGDYLWLELRRRHAK